MIRREVDKEKEKQKELCDEIASLNQQLVDANQGLLAASRISDQLETLQISNSTLKEECKYTFLFGVFYYLLLKNNTFFIFMAIDFIFIN